MLKRLALLICSVVALPLVAVAQPPESGPESLAQYFPASTAIYISTRTDADFLEQINGMSAGLAAVAQLTGGQSATLFETFDAALAPYGLSLDDIRPWLGDQAALGMMPSAFGGMSQPAGAVVIRHTDRAAVEAFISDLVGDLLQAQSNEFLTLFVDPASGLPVFAIDHDVLMFPLSPSADPLVSAEPRLDTLSAFQQAVDALPADSYNVLAYIDPAFVGSVPITPTMTAAAAPLALGLTILDDQTYTIDTAQLPLPGVGAPAVPIAPSIASHVPQNASAVVMATDLAGLLTTAAGFFDQINADAGAQPMLTTVERNLRAVGIDLEDDVLSWATGSYALFVRTDVQSMLNEMAAGQTPDGASVLDAIDFGLVIDATDPQAAAALAEKLGAAVAGSGAPGTDVRTETILGTPVTVISATVWLDPRSGVPVEFVTGANDEVFVFGTRAAAEAVLSTSPSLLSSPTYTDARGYLLPDPSSIWYTDGQGFVVVVAGGTVGALAMLGPAVNNVFENVVADLSEQAGAAVPPTVTPAPAAAFDPQALILPLQAGIEAVAHSTISSTVTDSGVTLLRLTITGAQ